jgi:hypothetical protein
MKHKHSRLPPLERRPIGRIALAFLGILIVATGILTLLSGRFYYPNWRGASVFSPFAIFGGLIALVAAVRGRPFRG